LAIIGRDQAELRRRAAAAAEIAADQSWDDVGRAYLGIFRQQAEFVAFQQKYGG
jgi:hypothetical protein